MDAAGKEAEVDLLLYSPVGSVFATVHGHLTPEWPPGSIHLHSDESSVAVDPKGPGHTWQIVQDGVRSGFSKELRGTVLGRVREATRALEDECR